MHAVTGRDGHRFGQILRRAVGLERGVGVIALVFHLEHFAVETDFHADAGGRFVFDGSDIFERLPRFEMARKISLFHRAIPVFDGAGFA